MTERVVVISGATGATGKAAATAFAQRGDSLVLLGRDKDRLAALQQDLSLPEPRILALQAELTDAAAVRSAAGAVEQKYGGAHILIHLVGGWTGGKTLVETDEEDLNSMLCQHANSTFNLIKYFVPQLEKAGWGRVLAVSSPVASQPIPKRGAYAAGKAAQEAIMLSMAEEKRGTGITSNIILVDAIDVSGSGKGARPQEIVSTMLYLCSDEAARINGVRIPLR